MSTLLDGQVGFAAESAWGDATTPDVFYEVTSGIIKPTMPVMTGASRRPGQRAVRSDRVWRPGMTGISGGFEFQPISKGNLSALLAPVMGTVGTSGPTDSAYVHAGSYGDLAGDSLCVQYGVPDAGGTVRVFTYAGCKVGTFRLAGGIDEFLTCGIDFAHAKSVTTATALAAASYPAGAELFDWTGGSCTFDGAARNIERMEFVITNTYKIRRYMGAATNQGEPLENGDREATFSVNIEFADLSDVDRYLAATVAAGNAKIVGTWQAPTLIGVTAKPKVVVTFEIADILDAFPAHTGPDLNVLTVTGVARYDGSNSPAKIEVTSTDATP